MCTRGSCSSSTVPQEDRVNVALLSGYGKGVTVTDLLASLCPLNHDLHGQHQLSTPNYPLNYFRPLCLVEVAKVEASTILSGKHAPCSTTPCTEGRSAVSTELQGGK